MALNFYKEDSLISLMETAAQRPHKKTGANKLSKPKFFILLTCNLLLWLFVSGFYLNVTPATIRESFREYSKRRGLVVTGVVCNKEMQAAIISDKIYEVGDEVKGYTIVEINKEGVEFRKGERKIFRKISSL